MNWTLIMHMYQIVAYYVGLYDWTCRINVATSKLIYVVFSLAITKPCNFSFSFLWALRLFVTKYLKLTYSLNVKTFLEVTQKVGLIDFRFVIWYKYKRFVYFLGRTLMLTLSCKFLSFTQMNTVNDSYINIHIMIVLSMLSNAHINMGSTFTIVIKLIKM